ncbi:Tmc1p NDAI_0F00600 [Naumovozyma dairenensis CBS 421]|uniref:AN1-type domain-containing protein n=1 Tax=Naumovozyma dairenensis (strain ATCC 10597 / BCRC 20456 / CBS 421 / NBRC 0211 / NRRL Y-12639) TaxID=1071378 RepID=G0WC68_NAUDC|nr:hypothetical protein NDAI_0F00600 [Naumovozyma dairenensis CBS 421]CCD25379.1 hypothetical protein NDAI_0F00600 [Naumovozyma dairenensis CBS 421]
MESNSQTLPLPKAATPANSPKLEGNNNTTTESIENKSNHETDSETSTLPSSLTNTQEQPLLTKEKSHRVEKNRSKSNKTKKGKKGKSICYYGDCISPIAKFIGECKFCDRQFCSRHRLLETHSCEGLVSCKEEMHKKNADKLSAERTKNQKIEI